MQVIRKTDDLYYLILPYNLNNYKEEEIILKIKKIFLNYNQKYNLLEPGFYEVNVYNHNLVGTILLVEKIDTFEFSKEVDLRIILKDKIKLYLELIDPIEFNKYLDKIDLDEITYLDYLKLLEHSNIIIDQKKVLN